MPKGSSRLYPYLPLSTQMNSSSFCSAKWLAGLKRKSALSANCYGWRPHQGIKGRALLDNFSPLIFTALPRSAQSTESSWNIKSRFIQFGFANLLPTYQALPQSLQATWSREHYAIFLLFSSSQQPESPPESEEFRACHFQVIAGVFLRMRAFLPAALLNLIRSEHGRSLRKLGLLHAMLCINAHIAHIDMYIFVSQLIFSSEIFHVQVRLKTLQLGRMKDSSNSLLALNGCTTRASICGILWLVISCPCHWVIILKWVSRCGIAVSTWGKQNRAIHNWPKPCHIRLQLCPLDTCCALLLLPAATSQGVAWGDSVVPVCLAWGTGVGLGKTICFFVNCLLLISMLSQNWVPCLWIGHTLLFEKNIPTFLLCWHHEVRVSG